MPTPVVDLPGAGGADLSLRVLLGNPNPPPPPPVAIPTLGGAPILSSNPGPGAVVSLDAAGRLAVAAGFLSVVTADPTQVRQGQFWYRSDTSQLCVCTDGATIKRVTLA